MDGKEYFFYILPGLFLVATSRLLACMLLLVSLLFTISYLRFCLLIDMTLLTWSVWIIKMIIFEPCLLALAVSCLAYPPG